MTLGHAPGAALAAYAKRKDQIERWSRSDTAKESIEIKNRPKRVNFAEKCIFLAASSSGDKAQVSRMLRDGYDINVVDEDGITALHQACIEDNIDMVEFLLDHGADVNISDNEGWTPLHAVASCNFTSIAKVLLEHGGNIAALNNDCSLPLDICKNDDIKELFKADLAAKGIDVGGARKAEELTMMEHAKIWAVNGYSEEPHPTTGATAMHVAACKGYIKVLDKLVKAGADVNAYDFDGWTPLHAAAHWGQLEACRVLLEGNCDPTLLNNCYQSALDVADLCVAPLLEQYKKKDEASKKRDATAGKLNVLPLPPKKKSLRVNLNDDIGGVGSVHQSTKKEGDLINRNVTTTTSSDDNEEEEEFGGSEAEDTVGDLPSSMEPIIESSHSVGPIINNPSSTNPIDTSVITSRLQPKIYDEDNTQDEASLPRRINRESNKTNTASTTDIFLKPRDRDAFSNAGFGDTGRTRKLGESEKVSSSLPSLSSTSNAGAPQSSSVASTKSDYLKPDAGGGGDTDEGVAAWRRGGSLRTRAPAAAVTVPEEDTSATSGDKAAVRRTRSEASPDVSLRRAYSFESDSKFYSRLVVARERLKAIEAVSAAMSANLLDVSSFTNTANVRLTGNTNTSTSSSTTSESTSITTTTVIPPTISKSNTVPMSTIITVPGTSSADLSRGVRKYTEETKSERLFNKGLNCASSDYNPEVILRRKEVDTTRGSVRPTTISTTNSPLVRQIPGTTGQLRSDGESSPATTPTTPSPPATTTKIGPVSKFKQFLIKSFVPPARDEESETQRKAHAKRVRETRRSTQGVTLEELKSAEQYVKAQQSNDSAPDTQTPECPPTSTTVPASTATGTSTTTNTGIMRKEDDSLERRPSWRLRVDDADRSKFSLEDLRTTGASPQNHNQLLPHGDTRGGKSDTNPELQHSPMIRARRHELRNNRPPRPPEEDEDGPTDDKDSKSGAQGAIAKKKRPKRRSTGVVAYSSTTWSDDFDGPQIQSDTESSRRGSDVEGTGPESPKSENGIVTKINYKKLYEEMLKENQQLKSRVSGLEDEINQLKITLERTALSTRIGSDVVDKREKRALELKFQEMEDELKLLQKLKLEGEKLKAENRALTRVVSKLSGGNSSHSNQKANNANSSTLVQHSTAPAQSARTLMADNQKLRDENGALIRVISKLSK